jgi:hypothetical protein
MIEYLKKNFYTTSRDPIYSLGIYAGQNGARLSHGHSKQYQFVLQTLELWKNILNEMFMLWTLAENDLLSNGYRLMDTGQGLNRVQPAPKVSRIMHALLHRVQKSVESWVGSSVVHLGDHVTVFLK